jgi:hypothetical protein
MSKPLAYLLVVTFFLLLIVIIGFERGVSAQLTGCPPQWTIGGVPAKGWSRGITGARVVNFFLSQNFTWSQREQIKSALTKWGSASQQTCLEVSFSEVTSQNDSDLYIIPVTSGGTRTQIIDITADNTIEQADIYFDSNDFSPTSPGYDNIYHKAALHEIGHTMGLGHPPYPQTAGRTVMNDGNGVNDINNYTAANVQPCDTQSVSQNPQCQPPPPSEGCYINFSDVPTGKTLVEETENSQGLREPGDGQGSDEYCRRYYGEWSSWDPINCECVNNVPSSPIIIDVLGDGINLTNAQNGVQFDLNSDSVKEKLSWSSALSDDAWLSLDRNGNSSIDDGTELFGNFTPQPVPPQGIEKNGFLALAEYDKPQNGGNGDGIVNIRDDVFLNLRLWQDTNHNGISELNELKSLISLGVMGLELDYKESRRRDIYGNRFIYRSKLQDSQGNRVNHWAWDVFLLEGH